MTKRRQLLVALVAVAGLTLLAGWWYFVRPPGINRRGFDRIRTGMSRPEVEALLGGPPGDYTVRSRAPGESCAHPLECVSPETDVSNYRSEAWTDGERTVCVYFHAGGTVADKEYMDFSLPPPTLWERVRRWLGW
jgi:hypothetical protein